MKADFEKHCSEVRTGLKLVGAGQKKMLSI